MTIQEEIFNQLELYTNLLEYHQENPFKIKSFQKAVNYLEKSAINLAVCTREELEALPGIGKSIAQFILDCRKNIVPDSLQLLLSKTPEGVISLFNIRGLNASKIRILNEELGIESIEKLKTACESNKLADVKGFGKATEEKILANILFAEDSKGKLLLKSALSIADNIIKEIQNSSSGIRIEMTGEVRRKEPVVTKIEFVAFYPGSVKIEISPPNPYLHFHDATENNFYKTLFETTAGPDFPLEFINYPDVINSEEDIFKFNKLQFIAPELRESVKVLDLAAKNAIPELIKKEDLQGCLHNHSTYSDGTNTLEEMVNACIERKLNYFGISDHSKSAGYANGMKEDRILKQHEEIDALNGKYAPFHTFKGIESDILANGDLDYPEEILKTFDFVVASIHSNLTMDEKKATARLIKAIENPYTTILGHPTGRLLLYRQGYPVDMKKVIDACAANGVIMELNCSSARMDIDWKYIPYCLEKGVLISINPDAHNTGSIDNMDYGVMVARKGMVTKENCFNAFATEDVKRHFESRKK